MHPLLVSWHFVSEPSAINILPVSGLYFHRIFFYLQFHSIVSLASLFLSHVSDSVTICYSVMAKYEQQANLYEWIVVTNRFLSGSIFINNWLINIVTSHRYVFRRGWHYRLRLFFFFLVMIKTHTLEQQKADWFNGFSLIVNEVLKVNALFKTLLF